MKPLKVHLRPIERASSLSYSLSNGNLCNLLGAVSVFFLFLVKYKMIPTPTTTRAPAAIHCPPRADMFVFVCNVVII